MKTQYIYTLPERVQKKIIAKAKKKLKELRMSNIDAELELIKSSRLCDIEDLLK